MGTTVCRTVSLALAALLASCAASPRAEPEPAPSGPAPWFAVGTPLGDEPEGWEDLRDVPFELHLVGPNPDPRWRAVRSVLLELRPGGQVEPGTDGERCLPRGLYRDEVVGYSSVPVRFGSGADGHLIVPFRGWAAALPLHLQPDDARERSIRETTLDIVLVRVLAEEVREATLESGGVLDPAPEPLGGSMTADDTAIWHDIQVRRRRRSDPEPSVPAEPSPFDTKLDLVEARDSKGRRVTWMGSTLGGGSMTSTFTIEREIDAAIAYPVHLRVRNPLRWSRRTYRFEIRDLPLPE